MTATRCCPPTSICYVCSVCSSAIPLRIKVYSFISCILRFVAKSCGLAAERGTGYDSQSFGGWLDASYFLLPKGMLHRRQGDCQVEITSKWGRAHLFKQSVTNPYSHKSLIKCIAVEGHSKASFIWKAAVKNVLKMKAKIISKTSRFETNIKDLKNCFKVLEKGRMKENKIKK